MASGNFSVQNKFFQDGQEGGNPLGPVSAGEKGVSFEASSQYKVCSSNTSVEVS